MLSRLPRKLSSLNGVVVRLEVLGGGMNGLPSSRASIWSIFVNDEVCFGALVAVFPAVAVGVVAGADEGRATPRRFAAASAARLTSPSTSFDAAVLKTLVRSATVSV